MATASSSRLWAVAYGFRTEGVKPGVRVVPDDREVAPGWTAAGVARHIFERVGIDDWSCWRVARELSDLRIPTYYQRIIGRQMRGRRTSGSWSDGRIRNMVVLPVYRG